MYENRAFVDPPISTYAAFIQAKQSKKQTKTFLIFITKISIKENIFRAQYLQ